MLSILLYTYRLYLLVGGKSWDTVVAEGDVYHLMYFLWSFMITSMKSSTVAAVSKVNFFSYW